jgi:hypothetical protein
MGEMNSSESMSLGLLLKQNIDAAREANRQYLKAKTEEFINLIENDIRDGRSNLSYTPQRCSSYNAIWHDRMSMDYLEQWLNENRLKCEHYGTWPTDEMIVIWPVTG